ncbi:MAG: transglutaminase family protein [Bryobacter sp.]
MFFCIQHQTRFAYEFPITESLMELRMQPRSEGTQRCHSFLVKVNPRARVLSYRDHLGNHVHHFNVAARHDEMLIVTEAMVETSEPEEIPERLETNTWHELDHIVASEDHWEFLLASDFARPTPLLEKLAAEIGVDRSLDPLSAVHQLNNALFEKFEYVPKHTSVNSPIDHALEDRKGVCQDYAHILTALIRGLGIPCRYVSGYVYRGDDPTGATRESTSHAWVEALLPRLGWVGLDPTNAMFASERHIRTAIGRDYADVPPTKGVFRGNAQSDLNVLVRVTRGEEPMVSDLRQELWFNAQPPTFGQRSLAADAALFQRQQQQQQQ